MKILLKIFATAQPRRVSAASGVTPRGRGQTFCAADTQPFPATSVKWTYKAAYRVNDQMVGLWNQPASVTVPA